MDPIYWSIIFLLLGFLLMLAEVFVPSGGILGLLSVLAIASSIGGAFYQRGLETGIIFVAVAVVLVPLVLTAAFKYWPHTPMGRQVLLGVPTEAEVLPNTAQSRTLKALVGKVGMSKSLMLPSGAVSIEGLTVDALSDGPAIEPGSYVRVIEVRGNRVIVTQTDEAPGSQRAADPAAGDILDQPLDSLGLDDDPLA
jgi:membrane-bound serine protease (ClpP class)